MNNSKEQKMVGFPGKPICVMSISVLLCMSIMGRAEESIGRLDFKDLAGNLLMSLDYKSPEAQTLFDGLDGNGNCGNDGYVLRRSRPEYDGSGRLKNSAFIDWDDRKVNWATYSYSDGGGAGFTFYDHYEKNKTGSGKKVYGGSYSRSGDKYTFKNEQGTATHSLDYTYGEDGRLKSIDVLDKNGSKTHEVVVVYNGVNAASVGNRTGVRSRHLTMLGDGTAVLNLNLTAAGNLKVEQYNMTGRLVAVLDQRTVRPGSHILRFKTSPAKSAASVRLLRISINGDSQVHRFTTVK